MSRASPDPGDRASAGTCNRGVRIRVLHPEDLMAPTIGGIATFLRDFVRFAPDDFDIEMVGATADAVARPIGKWHAWAVGDREVQFLPLVRAARPDHLSRIPVSARFTLALAAHRGGRAEPGRTLQFHRPDVPLAFMRHRGPSVEVVHIDVHRGPQATRWRHIPGAYRFIEDATIPRMSRVFVANRLGVRLYRERYPERSDHIEFLSGWFNDSVFTADGAAIDAVDRARELAALGVPEMSDRRIVLFVGRLEEEKDPLRALEAFARLAAHPIGERGVALLVAGEGSLRHVMEHRVATAGLNGKVRFVGAQAQDVVAQLMRASDVLLVTSRSEGGGPRVVVEALASGLPVVSTVVGEVLSVVRDGQNGFLAHDRTPETLAAALGRVLAMPREQASAAAVVAAAPFAARRVLAALYDAHREIAARPSRK